MEDLDENPDCDPWSIRQTAVYQQFNSAKSRNMLLVITPSHITRGRLDDVVSMRIKRKGAINPFHLHLTLISSLHENWRHYIRALERTLKYQVRNRLDGILCSVPILK